MNFGKNILMARVIDFVNAIIIILLCTFVWSVLLFADWRIALVFSIAFTICVAILLRSLIKRKNTPYGVDRLALEFALRDDEYVIKLLLSAIKNDKIENGRNYILLENGVIISKFKFSPLSPSDVANVCGIAKKLDRKEAFVIAKGIDRRAFQIADVEGVKVQIIKTKAVFKFLKKHNALPSLSKAKTKISAKGFFEIALSRQNFKHYAFSGGVLLLTSFMTPLKVYYLIVGSILLALALICLTPLGNGSLTSPKALDMLEKEVEEEYRRE